MGGQGLIRALGPTTTGHASYISQTSTRIIIIDHLHSTSRISRALGWATRRLAWEADDLSGPLYQLPVRLGRVPASRWGLEMETTLNNTLLRRDKRGRTVCKSGPHARIAGTHISPAIARPQTAVVLCCAVMWLHPLSASPVFSTGRSSWPPILFLTSHGISFFPARRSLRSLLSLSVSALFIVDRGIEGKCKREPSLPPAR